MSSPTTDAGSPVGPDSLARGRRARYRTHGFTSSNRRMDGADECMGGSDGMPYPPGPANGSPGVPWGRGRDRRPSPHSVALLAPLPRPIGCSVRSIVRTPVAQAGFFSHVLCCHRTPSPPIRKAKVRRVRLYGQMRHAAVLYDVAREKTLCFVSRPSLSVVKAFISCPHMEIRRACAPTRICAGLNTLEVPGCQ